MRLFTIRKDGGSESRVTGYFLVEIKSLFSIVLLRFDPGTRPAYHTHAFNTWSWRIKGRLVEREMGHGPIAGRSLPRLIYTPRSMFHQVESLGTSWVLSFRGPWKRHWCEYTEGKTNVLAHGRKVVL